MAQTELIMRDTAFITTKPLQILVALSIVKQFNIHDSAHFLVVDNFYKARTVCERLTSVDWEFSRLNFEFCPTYKDAYELVSKNNIKNLFVDSDVGFENFVTLLKLKARVGDLEVNVYEEGLGTYRDNLYGGVKRAIFNLFGIGTHFGGCALVKGLYLYNTEEYRQKFPKFKKKIQKINPKLEDFFRMYMGGLKYVFDYKCFDSPNDQICYVYLSGWEIHKNFMTLFLNMRGDKFIKPHPAINSDDLGSIKEGVRVVPNHVPAELLIIDLGQKYNKIVIFHEGSSAERYVSGENVEFFRCEKFIEHENVNFHN